MKRILLLALICNIFEIAYTQTITAKVVDAANDKPLSYAIILYNAHKNITYTDENGFFYLQKDSLQSNDSVLIQYLGYRNLSVGVRELKDNATFKMMQEVQSLRPVVVTNCKTKQYVINKRVGRIKHYIGPGPETKFVIISKYNNTPGREGYLNKIEIYIDETSRTLKVPVRLRWYEWDSSGNKPGRELTDTNILVYPYKDGWNEFVIPTRVIFCMQSQIVFGLEFIYAAEYQQLYAKLKTDKEKIRWLTDMQNRWSLGMQLTDDFTERSFYIINNQPLNEYTRQTLKEYSRPAIKFTFTGCK